MDFNNFRIDLNNLKFNLLAGNLNNEEILSILSGAIDNNDINNSDMRTIIYIIRKHYFEELSIFNKNLIELIETKFFYDDIQKAMMISNSGAACREGCSPAQEARPQTAQQRRGNERRYKDVVMDRATGEKTITTYRLLEDGSKEKIDVETIKEPDLDQIFTNILGNKFKTEDNTNQISENDL